MRGFAQLTALAILGIVSISIALPASSPAPTPHDAVAAEIARLQQLASSQFPPGLDSPGLKKGIIDGLTAAETALRDGRLYLSLHRLLQQRSVLVTIDYVGRKSGVAKDGLEGLDREWERVGAALAEKERVFSPASLKHLPAAVRALAESSSARSRPYHQSSRLYGKNSRVQNGFYYLGASLARMDSALFCQNLRFPPSAPTEMPSVEAALAGFESEVLDAYRPPASIEHHKQFITANSALKLARELSQQGRPNGALLQYLDARLSFRLINPGPHDKQQLSSLQTKSRAVSARLGSSELDHSIARLYWEVAEDALAAASEGGSSAEHMATAAIILEDILPTYFQLLEGNRQ